MKTTTKKQVMRRIRHYRLLSYLAFSVFLAIVGMHIIGGTNPSPGTEFIAWSSMIIGVALWVLVSYKRTEWWNNLTLDERCQELASDLHSGQKGWYLNSYGAKYFFAPLERSNMNEMGGGPHISTTREEVLRLLKAGKLENPELAEKTIYHFDCLQ